MDILTDVALLSRIQFALTVAYHFIFVPLSIGLGLITAIFATKYYRSRDEKDGAAVRLWVKIFTATFAIGVATGITMEFSFGTNWADYSRFVGDIFGAPLAAEALFAFFLESVFLGVLLFGRNKVSPKFYTVSAWLVWAGSLLSALWILIANSWMQTPAGAELAADGKKAIITDFLAAAMNPSIAPRYFHVIVALLIIGAFTSLALGGWYLLKNKHTDFAMKTVRIGAVVGIVASCAMIVTAHASAVQVSEEQPTKLAMMEGMYDSEVPPLYAVGIVDEDNQEVIAPFAIPGGTSFLATGNFETEYPGLNELAQTEEYGDMVVEDMPVGLVFQSYHLMVAMYGLIMLTSILVLVFTFKGGRIARAILYAASVLNQSGGTLQGLFRQIIEDRTDILFPVKDLEIHRGLGFAAWCDNNHIQIGTRRFLEQEGVALPDEDYENQHSKNGELQILYLAVSGNVHAMFVIRYVGGRNIARSLAALQQENIRLLVTSLDPSLTAKHITEAYRLPEGMVTLLDQEQCAALEAAPAEDAPCCMYHQKGFASLTGGLRAADKAQNAETTATTVQMVSVLFSVAIAVLLTSARSIWQLPVTYVLMYQAAWSALSIAVCALKQHN